jgi:hypothetical protein
MDLTSSMRLNGWNGKSKQTLYLYNQDLKDLEVEEMACIDAEGWFVSLVFELSSLSVSSNTVDGSEGQ